MTTVGYNEPMESSKIQIGQMWQDLDYRNNNRQVKICGISKLQSSGVVTVEYKARGRHCRSEQSRFLKAFKLIV